MAGRDDVILDVNTEVTSLRTIVTDLLNTVGRLSTDVSGLMAVRDGGVYGESCGTDQGPAVRARLFEGYARPNDDNGRRITELIDQVLGLEATLAEMTTIQTNYHLSVDQW